MINSELMLHIASLHSQMSKGHKLYKVHPIGVKIKIMNMGSTMSSVETAGINIKQGAFQGHIVSPLWS
jgi:hypothetical protein